MRPCLPCSGEQAIFPRMLKRWVLFVGLMSLFLCACGGVDTAVTTPTAAPTQPAATQTATAVSPPTNIPTITAQTVTPIATATVIAAITPEKPTLRYLQAAIEETLADFDGFSSYIVIDLESGEQIARNADVALAGMSLVKVPILINTYRVLDNPPDIEQTKLITQTTALSSNFAANLLLRLISEQNDPYVGADVVTQSMRDLSLYNTFIAVPIDLDSRPERLNTYLTPANQRTDITTYADPFRQITIGDMAQLLEMIYTCAQNDNGPLREMYPDQLSSQECEEMLSMLQLNELAQLLELGIPEEAIFAHKVGWIDDTHGDGGIVFSAGGDYIIVMALFTPEWLEWEDSAPLFEEVSRLTYAHFNAPNLYAGQELPPEPTSAPVTPLPELPHAIVTNTQGIGLTVRDVPGGAEVAIVPEGSILTLLETAPQDEGGFRWHLVRLSDGKEGWAAADFFTPLEATAEVE